MAQMKPRVSNQPATFFWHGILILLPVLVLVTVGLFSLRQDKLLAQREAEDRAQSMADELVSKVWSALNRTEAPQASQQHAFEVDSSGCLLSPPPYSVTPSPRVPDLSALNSNQALLWLSAQRADAAGQDTAQALQANSEFLDSKPPDAFAAKTLYAQGLLRLKQGEPQSAADCFGRLLKSFPEAIGESGLPLRPLAELRLFELQSASSISSPFSVSLESVCSNAVCRPTQLSWRILEQISQKIRSRDERRIVEEWMRLWREQESTRALFLALSPRFAEQAQGEHLLSGSSSSVPGEKPASPAVRTAPGPPGAADGQQSGSRIFQHSPITEGLRSKTDRAPGSGVHGMFWFSPPLRWDRVDTAATNASHGGVASVPLPAPEDQDWMALEIGVSSSSNRWFVCRSENELLADLARVVTDTIRLPDYFALGLELAGKQCGRRQRSWPVFDLRRWQEVDYFGRNGGGQKKEFSNELSSTILASAVRREQGLERLKLSIYLTSQSALFKVQRARTFWFGLLVAASAGAALVGLLTTYRAFRRQLHLAELKGNFVSSVSHELRAPIAAVRLMAENLDVGRVSDASKQREYYRFIVQECRRLSALIENVLDFSRIDQGRKEYEFEPTDLAALVTQTAKLMEPYAAERQLSIRLQIPTELPGALQILADGKALQQALINLIDNALKHSPKGATVTVGLETTARQEAAVREQMTASESSIHNPVSSVRLWVEDHGDGIPASEHEKIFERFYRCGSELRRETQGVGIGLSIVKHVVEAHGGRVLVRSAPGLGSRFTIELPIVNSEEAKTRRVQ